MLNYLRAECYKVIHRKYTWIALGVVLALGALLVGLWAFTTVNGSRVDFYTGAGVLAMLMNLGFWATMITGDIVFSEQYKFNTLKNEVSFGIPRARIYLGKLIAQTLLSLFACIVMIGFYLGLCALTLVHDPEQDRLAMLIVGWCLLVDLPLWIGVQALTCAVYFSVRSSMVASLVVVGVLGLVPTAVSMAAIFCHGPAALALEAVYDHLPAILAGKAAEFVGVWGFCGKAWLVGAVWFAVSTAAGMWGFSRKEIA